MRLKFLVNQLGLTLLRQEYGKCRGSVPRSKRGI
jgi:hypothetical protein